MLSELSSYRWSVLQGEFELCLRAQSPALSMQTLSQTLKRSHSYPLWSFRFRLYKNNIDFCFLNLCAQGVRWDHEQMLDRSNQERKISWKFSDNSEKNQTTRRMIKRA